MVMLLVIISLAQGSTAYRDSNQYIVPDQSVALPAFLELHTTGKVMGGHYIPPGAARHELPAFSINAPLPKGEAVIVVVDDHSRLWNQLKYMGDPHIEKLYDSCYSYPKIYENGTHHLYLIKSD